jgi:hypothetical protein
MNSAIKNQESLEEQRLAQKAVDEKKWKAFKLINAIVSIPQLYNLVLYECDIWGPYLHGQSVELEEFKAEALKWLNGNTISPLIDSLKDYRSIGVNQMKFLRITEASATLKIQEEKDAELVSKAVAKAKMASDCEFFAFLDSLLE